MTFFLKFLDYADDIWLPSHRVMDLGQMALDLERKASRVGLNKTKVLSLTAHRVLPIYINGQGIEGID